MSVPGVPFHSDQWCVALYEMQESSEGPDPYVPTAYRGSGFLFPGGLVVSCWHCLHPPRDGKVLAAIRGNDLDAYQFCLLRDVSQDRSGFDLATAAAPAFQGSPLVLAHSNSSIGQRVMTVAHAGTIGRLSDGDRGSLRFEQPTRTLQGYVTRTFKFQPLDGGRVVPSWEVDMPCPAGSSGAPLILTDSLASGRPLVIGVIHGRHLALSEPDHEMGLPNYVFGLAHYLDTVKNLTGDALGDQTLHEYMLGHGAVGVHYMLD